MNILFWVPYPTKGASNRYRVEQYLPYLAEAGISGVLRPFWNSRAFEILYKKGFHFTKFCYFISGTISRVFDLFMIFKYDAVFIHREAYPVSGAFFEAILSILKKPFVFDFDDAIFLNASSSSNNFIEKYKKPGKVIDIIRMSKCVICGNKYLADFALHYNRSVYVIPTPIDTANYYTDKKKDGGDIVIGWIGSFTTLGFLNNIKDVFVRLSERFSHVRFKIVGGDFSVEGLTNVYSKQWSLKEEIGDLRTFDIGIMPMPDNKWTRGKCGFKIILYMSMGIPCISSAVGVNKEIITDGVNGFLVNRNDEWVERLSILIEDRRLRERIGLAGRKTVEEKYSVKVNADKFLEVIRIVNDRIR